MGNFLPEFKSRKEPNSPPIYVETRPNGLSTNWTKSMSQGWLTESIISQCHTGTWPPPLDSDVDVGGLMSLNRTWDSFPDTAVVNANIVRGTLTMLQMIGYSYGQDTAAPGSTADLNTFGTSAIAKVLPTNPVSSMATALGELRKDGLPRLPGSSMRDQVDLARRAGNEFLNIEFGWLPLVNDLRKFAYAVKHTRSLIDQYTRDSDRKIRRRFVAHPQVLPTTVFTGTGRAPGNIFLANSTVTRRAEVRYWFSGAFKYHVPVDSDFMGRFRRYEAFANHLFGTRITPEVVWNLAPWSWAIDWFTNAGDVIHNISTLGHDGLVMQYGYAMRHMRAIELHRGVTNVTNLSGASIAVTLSREFGSETKQRVAAHPYGFGVDDVSLSAIQLAILAALGLTRGQRGRQ